MPPAAGTLPFPVVYTALGVLLKRRDYGVIQWVEPAEVTRAIQIATAARQKQGHLFPGTRILTPCGCAWLRAIKREIDAKAAQDEWERLVELSREASLVAQETARASRMTAREINNIGIGTRLEIRTKLLYAKRTTPPWTSVVVQNVLVRAGTKATPSVVVDVRWSRGQSSNLSLTAGLTSTASVRLA